MAAVHLNVLIHGASYTLMCMISYLFRCAVDENTCVDALGLPSPPAGRSDELRPCSMWVADIVGDVQSTVDGRCLYQIIV